MNLRKILSLTLCCLLCMIMLAGCSTAPTPSADQQAAEPTAEPTAEPAASASSPRMLDSFMSIIQADGYDRDNIKTVTFLNTLANIPGDAHVWDFSQQRNNSVRAWVTEAGDMFIAGEGGVTATGCKKLFNDCSGLTTVQFGGCFYTVGVEDFSFMFNNCASLTAVDLTSLDTSSATSMNSMFRNCGKLASVDFSSFNTSKVTDMAEMFYACIGLTAIDLSSFDTSNVTSMKAMFENCGWITSIDVSSFNTAKVADFSRMFLNCPVLSELNLSGFDFSAAKDLSHMFMWDEKLTDIGCTITVPEGAAAEKMYANSGLK